LVAHSPDLGKPLRPGQLVAELLEHSVAGLHRRPLIRLSNQHGLVAVNIDGSPIRPETYSKAFAAHCAAAGVPAIRLHDVRHTAATMLQFRRRHHTVGDGQEARA
jgi:integrase